MYDHSFPNVVRAFFRIFRIGKRSEETNDPRQRDNTRTRIKNENRKGNANTPSMD